MLVFGVVAWVFCRVIRVVVDLVFGFVLVV